jgi:signal transduction histidine kinase
MLNGILSRLNLLAIGAISLPLIYALTVSILLRPQDLDQHTASTYIGERFLLKDVDGDRQDEVFILDLRGSNPHILHVDGDLQPINHQYLTEGLAMQTEGSAPFVRTAGWADVDADNLPELGFSLYLQDSVRIEFYDCIAQNDGPVRSLTFPQGQDSRGLGYWDGRYSAVGWIDTDRDGHQELLMHVSTSLNYQPRALFAFDLIRDSILWWHDFGAAIGHIQIADYTGDRSDEILMGSYAWSNGAGEIVNGTNDDRSYAIMLDRQGNLIWRRQLGGVFSWCTVVGVPRMGNRPSQVFAAVTPSKSEWADEIGQHRAATGRIVELDAFTAEFINEMDQGSAPSAWQSANPEHVLDGGKGFLTAGRDGRLRLYGLNLTLQAESQRLVQPIVRQVVDINSDGTDEVVVITGDNRVVVFNSALEPLLTYQSEGANVRDAGVRVAESLKALRLLISTTGGHGTILAFRVPPPGSENVRTLHRRISKHRRLLILLILAGPIPVLLARRRVAAVLQRARLRLGRDQCGGQLVLSQEGYMIWINEEARAILGLRRGGIWKKLAAVLGRHGGQKLWEDLKARKTSQPEEPFLVALHGREGRKLITITRLGVFTSLGAVYEFYSIGDKLVEDAGTLVVDWFDLSSRIAHRMKSPLSQALRSIELARMSTSESVQDRPQEVTRALDDAEESIKDSVVLTNRFLRFPLKQVKSERLDLRALLEEAIDYAVFPLGVETKINLMVEAPSVEFRTDKELFKELIGLLLQNSIEALDSQTGEIRVSVRLARGVLRSQEHAEAIVIRIQDNGCGINEEDLAKVFEPFWTTKGSHGGTGLGLAMAKRICDLLSATIKIQSTGGEGTKPESTWTGSARRA